MCDTCGCSDTNDYKISKPGDVITKNGDHVHSHTHEHDHDHDHHHHDHNHEHNHTHNTKIDIETSILNKNDLLAERNRGYFEAKNIRCLNMVSSPGSGKTTLLETVIKKTTGKKKLFVIEGDQQTVNDANRIEKAGAPAIQINTGNGCHLDAQMINDGVKTLNPDDNSVLVIENVGNLVCPALFDLGEKERVVIISITEGEDKPLKYPNMFHTSQVCVINKIDLMPYLDFDMNAFRENALKVNHHLKFFELSATKGTGVDDFIEWILQ